MSKKDRKFDVGDSVYLNEMMQSALQVLHTLDTLSNEHGVDIENLEMPVYFKPALAYDLCSAVTHMYEKLLENELILSGNKTNQYIIH